MDDEVDEIVKWLRASIGTTYAQATTPSDENLLAVDMSRWGGDRSAAQKRARTPWAQRVAVMRDYREYVSGKLCTYCHWHRWV